MKILVQERRVRYVPCLMLFDIVFWPDLPNFEESKEEVNKSKGEVNKKGTRFRDKVDKLKLKGSRVGNFMPISKDDRDTYAFFMITCPLSSRTRIKTIMRENIEDGDLIFFK